MKRVVIFKQELTPKGGLEKTTLRIAKNFAEKGCEVTIFTATPFHLCPPLSGIGIVSASVAGFFHYTQLQAWDEACRSYVLLNPADVVLSFDRTTHQTHIRAGNGIHAAYLQRRNQHVSSFKSRTFSFNPLHRTLLRLEKEALASPLLQRIIVNSSMVAREAVEHYGIDPHRLHVLHNGVEWSELSDDFQSWPELRREAALEIGSDPHAFHFLFAGHEYNRKGLDPLLEGFSRLPGKDARLIVIGRDKNIRAYQRKALRLGLKNVYFLGPRRDIRRFYAMADAAVIPSLYDPFANVTLEALAMGLFTLSSRYNGGSEILTEKIGAIIPDLLDPDSVAEGLKLALRHPKTEESALEIRYSVRHFDYPFHLDRFTTACLS